jgi:hypothetical protein
LTLQYHFLNKTTSTMSIEFTFKVTLRCTAQNDNSPKSETRRYRYTGDVDPTFELLQDLTHGWWPQETTNAAAAVDSRPLLWQYEDSEGDIVTLHGNNGGEWAECLRNAREQSGTLKLFVTSAPKNTTSEAPADLRKQLRQTRRALRAAERSVALGEEPTDVLRQEEENVNSNDASPAPPTAAVLVVRPFYLLGYVFGGLQCGAKALQDLWTKREATTAAPVRTNTTPAAAATPEVAPERTFDVPPEVPPPTVPTATAEGSQLNADDVANILAVFPGLQQATVEAVLRSTGGNVHRAVDILMS